jgi:hypothetical protein
MNATDHTRAHSKARTPLNKNDELSGMLLATLFQQEVHLTSEDKKEFPLVERAIHTILEIWESNKLKIRNMDVKLIAEGQLLIQVNDGARVCFMSPLAQEAYATA